MPEIVVVDDSAADRLLLERALGANDPTLQIRTFADGRTALEHLLSVASGQAPLPRLVLLDLRMPRLGGLELLAELQASPQTRRIPVVVLATSSSRTDVLRAYELGACSYLVKPNRLSELEALIQTVKDYWLRAAITPDQV